MTGRPELLELACAAEPFLRAGALLTNGRRLRLRLALVAVIAAETGLMPPALLINQAEALAALAALLHRCEVLRVPWAEVVALVNRGYEPEKQGR